jgi:16S rRNA (guanine966-N2)-methyltransferase
LRDSNQLRIIGGAWRRRKLTFPSVPGLRPTPDRIRETLFNWLQPVIAGARCLDLFSGSGALGLEALSRGAGEVVMVDQHAKVIAQLRNNLELLHATNALLVKADVVHYLQTQQPQTPFDIVFLDPPYYQNLVGPCCHALERFHWLTPETYIYIETESSLATLDLPKTWHLTKSKKASQVSYNLALCKP